jgi:hypothetical protein
MYTLVRAERDFALCIKTRLAPAGQKLRNNRPGVVCRHSGESRQSEAGLNPAAGGTSSNPSGFQTARTQIFTGVTA